MAFLDFLSPIFGSKPQIAQYTPVDMSAEQLKALEGNIAAWPDIQNLGNMFQQYMLNQYETAIPGFKDLLSMGGQSVKDMFGISQQLYGQGQDLFGKAPELFQQAQDLFGKAASPFAKAEDVYGQLSGKAGELFGAAEPFLQGQIPQDVQDAVQRSSAFQNLMSGGGGGMANANTARNYGLTSLDLINQGAGLLGQGSNILGQAGNEFSQLFGQGVNTVGAGANIFGQGVGTVAQGANILGEGASVASGAGNALQRWAALSGAQMPEGMLVTPQQQAALDMQQNLIQRNIQQQQFNVNAAPDPVAKGLSDIVANLTAAYVSSLGGGHGGGTGAPQAADWTKSAGDIAGTYGQGSNVSNAFGPSMDSAFSGTDAYGNPMSSGGYSSNISQGVGYGGSNYGGSTPNLGGTGYVPQNSYLPSGPNAYAQAYNFGGFDPNFGTAGGNFNTTQQPTPWMPNLYGVSDFNPG